MILLVLVILSQVRFDCVLPESIGIDSILGTPAVVDYNKDGHLDFFSTVVYLNDGTGRFTKLSQARWSSGRILCFGDYDRDGYPDIITNRRVNVGTENDTCFVLLYRNSGPPDFNLVDVSSQAGLGYPILDRDLNDVGFLDFDNDGWLDFYISSYEFPANSAQGWPDYLFHNNGNGTFTDVSDASGVSAQWLCSRGVSFADFDEDGDCDIFVSVYRLQPNLLWQNIGNGQFIDVAADKGVQGLYIGGWFGHNIGAAWGDYNNDGYLDLFSPITHHPGYPGDSTGHLWKNNGPTNWDFTDYFAGSGIRNSEIGSAPSWADYDNDGDLDLYWVNLYGYPYGYGWLYRNEGNDSFTDVTIEAGLHHYQRKNYALWADLNEDGFLDIFIPRYDGSNYYYEFWINNAANSNHWLQIDLEGVNSSKEGIGARINLFAGNLRVVREVLHNGGHGYGSPFVARQHFGLGTNPLIDSLTIRWSSQINEVYYNVPVDTIITLREGQGAIKEVANRKKISQSSIPTIFTTKSLEKIGDFIVYDCDGRKVNSKRAFKSGVYFIKYLSNEKFGKLVILK